MKSHIELFELDQENSKEKIIQNIKTAFKSVNVFIYTKNTHDMAIVKSRYISWKTDSYAFAVRVYQQLEHCFG